MTLLVEEVRPTSGTATRPRAPAEPGTRATTGHVAVPRCTETSRTFGGRPGGLAVAPDGTVFVSIRSSNGLLRLDATPALVNLAGPTSALAEGAPRILSPRGVAFGPDGTLFVADAAGHRVWTVSPSGERQVVAGSVYGYRDGPGDEACFRFPSDVAIGPDGTCYVADAGNHRIRAIAPDRQVSTLAGSIYDYGDGQGPDGRFREPVALDVDHDGTLYVADTGNNAVRRLTADGVVTTLAGTPPGGNTDGAGLQVGLRAPSGIAIDDDGDIWVADQGNGMLRRIAPTGTSSTALRLTARRWPVAVARAPGIGVLVAAEMLDDEGRPQTCLVSVGAR